MGFFEFAFFSLSVGLLSPIFLLILPENSRDIIAKLLQAVMQWTGSFWSSVTYVINILTLSPTEWATGRFQTPLLAHDGFNQNALEGPVFKPPTRRLDGPGSDFYCDYSAMKGFRNCSTFDNRGCWLRNDETGFEYNIEKNYEDLALTPIGITRRYRLDLAVDKSLNADGMNFAEGKVFNKTYPGPWIQACWGDVVILFALIKSFCAMLPLIC